MYVGKTTEAHACQNIDPYNFQQLGNLKLQQATRIAVHHILNSLWLQPTAQCYWKSAFSQPQNIKPTVQLEWMSLLSTIKAPLQDP